MEQEFPSARPGNPPFDLEKQLGTWLRRGASFKVRVGDLVTLQLVRYDLWVCSVYISFVFLLLLLVILSVYELNPKGGGAFRCSSVLINSNHGAP